MFNTHDLGMNNVDSTWHGMSATYEIRDGDYRFNSQEPGYSVKIQLPGGLSDQFDGRQGVPFREQVRPSLPPHKTSTGLRNTPLVPNPYLGQRDASYTYGADSHISHKTDEMYPQTSTSWDIPIPHDSFAIEAIQQPWQLGVNDLQSMFADHHHDAYTTELHNAAEIAKYCAAVHHSPEGPLNPMADAGPYDSVIESNMDSAAYRDAWIGYQFQCTREQEQWTERELTDISYHWLHDACQPSDKTVEPEAIDSTIEWASEPEIIMVADSQGKSTPMACGVMVVKDIQGRASSRLLRVLYDSGGSKSMCHRRVIPRGARLNQNEDRTLMRTLAGTYAPLGTVNMKGLRLPAFDKNRVIEEQEFHVFDADCQYDIILGGDFLKKVGMNLLYKTLEVEWFGNTIPMETLDKSTRIAAHVESYLSQMERDELGFDVDSYLSVPIMDAKYEKLDIETVVTEHCAHLTTEQQADLRVLLAKHAKLFDGTLGRYPGEPMHIEVEPGAQPVYKRPYPVPHVHLETFKKELDHLVAIGVLSPVRDTEWGLPTFITPKKDGRVRWVSDMRELNKVIKRTQYTLPIISDILRKRQGYEFLTKLDISMQYYTFELDEESKRLCTIVTPFGPYCYNRVPMGLKISPGYAQARMEEVLRGIEELDVYIDDIGVFTTTWARHIEVLSDVLQRLEDSGFTINPLKCEWGVKETDWLGYWLTPTGLKPWSKKVDSILKMKPPSNATEMRTFLGMVTYYRDMWPRRSHVLKPFTALSGLPKRAKIPWTPEMDTAFKQMKAIIAEDALMAYPNHNLPFDIYTDASDYQLGACIMQGGRPVAYYSRKLTSAQRNYTTMEKELLAIVMVLKEYRSMLLGAELNVFTDHRNLTFANFNTQRVLRWRCFIEEYSPNMFYLEGKLNVLADAFSRLPSFENHEVMEGKSAGNDLPPQPLDMSYVCASETELYDCLKYLPELDDYFHISDSLLNLPSTENNPLSYVWLKDMQDGDAQLESKCNSTEPHFHWRTFGDTKLVCYTDKDKSDDWKICLTDEAVEHAVTYFHQLLNHPGKHRLLQGMSRFYHPRLRQVIEAIRCDACQRYKVEGRGYGHLPARDVRTAPWEQVDVDLIGPWKVQTGTGRVYEFLALTSIDRVTGLPELIRIDNKTSEHVASKFEESWLSRYPRPFACCHDNGGEFTGWEFQSLLTDFGIRDVPTTSRNPAANGICERMHQTVGSVLRTLIHSHPPRTLTDAKALVDQSLATASHAIRTNVSQATGYSPGALAFHRDMLLDVPLIADLMAIRERRQLAVDENLRRVNAKRSSYDYQPGQQVMKKRHEWTKLGHRWNGPYAIQRVHVNGNITIELMPGVTERLNIRRVKPYHEPTPST